MQLPENGANNSPDSKLNMREGFLKKIGPIGSALILILSAVGIALAFTIDLGASSRYDSRHDESYYTQTAENMAELLDELREEVFPKVDGITDSYVSQDGTCIIIQTNKTDAERQLRYILRSFDQALFEVLG